MLNNQKVICLITFQQIEVALSNINNTTHESSSLTTRPSHSDSNRRATQIPHAMSPPSKMMDSISAMQPGLRQSAAENTDRIATRQVVGYNVVRKKTCVG